MTLFRARLGFRFRPALEGVRYPTQARSVPLRVLALALGVSLSGCSRDSSEPPTEKHAAESSGKPKRLPKWVPTPDDSASRNDCEHGPIAKLGIGPVDDVFFESGHIDLPEPCPEGMRSMCVPFESKDGEKFRHGAVCAAIDPREERICLWKAGKWDCFKG